MAFAQEIGQPCGLIAAPRLPGLMKPRTSLWVLAVVLVVPVAALSIAQTETVTVPAWPIQFVDQLHRPFVGLEIEQDWRDHSLEGESHRDSESTDENGIVTFPERRLRVSRLRQLLGPVSSFLFGGGIHAGYGPNASVFPVCGLRDRGPVLAIMRGGELPANTVLQYSDGALRRLECVNLEAQAREADRLVGERT